MAHQVTGRALTTLTMIKKRKNTNRLVLNLILMEKIVMLVAVAVIHQAPMEISQITLVVMVKSVLMMMRMLQRLIVILMIRKNMSLKKIACLVTVQNKIKTKMKMSKNTF